MFGNSDHFPVALVLRWLARILSIASIGLLMAFAFGPEERLDRPLLVSEVVMLAFFPVVALMWLVCLLDNS